MIEKQPTIYKAPTVYKQAGGGGGHEILLPPNSNLKRIFSLGATASSSSIRATISRTFKGWEIETVVKRTRFGNRWGWLYKTDTNTGLNFNPDEYYHIYSNGQNEKKSFGSNCTYRLLYLRTKYIEGHLDCTAKYGNDPGSISTVNFTLAEDGNFTNSQIKLFGATNSDDKCSMSICYLKVFEGDELKLFLVPVYDEQNNVYKFYDFVYDTTFNLEGGTPTDVVTDIDIELIK